MLAEDSEQEQSPRLNQSRVMAIAFVVLLLPLGIYLGTSSGGASGIAGCNNPPSLEQCGTASCNVGPAQEGCSITITFPAAFANVPKYETGQWLGGDPNVDHSERNIPAFTTYFQSDNGETWTNMPVALTEIYGTFNHETHQSATSLSSAVEAQFHVTCLTGSTSGTATLRPMFLDIVTGLWTELAQNTGSFDINVSGGNCINASLNPPGNLVSQFSAINSLIFTDNSGEADLAVFGFNGGGIGDVPVFNNIYLQFFTQIQQTLKICVLPPVGGPFGTTTCGVNSNPKTMMIIDLTISYPAFSGFKFNIFWIAVE